MTTPMDPRYENDATNTLGSHCRLHGHEVF